MSRRGGLLLGLPTLGRIRRPALHALSALLVAVLAGVPVPAEVRAQGLPESPRITVVPTCVPVPGDDVGSPITITVRGFSLDPGRIMSLSWAGQSVAAPGDAIEIGPYGTFEVAVTVFIGGGPWRYLLEAFYLDSLSAFPSAATFFDVPCPEPKPTISITPACAEPGTDIAIHIEGRGFAAGLPIQARVVDIATEQTVYAELPPHDMDPNAVSLDLPLTVPPFGAYRVIVDQVVPGEIFDRTPYTAKADFVAPCAELTVVPSCGAEGVPPGRYSLILTGTGFQPNLGLRFLFDPTLVNQEFYWDLSVNQDGSFGPVEINPYVRGPGEYEVIARQTYDGPVLGEARAIFSVPCSPGTVTLDPACAAPQFVGDELRSFTVNVAGFGFLPGLPVDVTFDPDGLSGPGYTPESTQATPGSDGSFLVPLTVSARPANSYRVAVVQQRGVVGTVPPFSVPCTLPSPILSVQPTCGADAPDQAQVYSIRLIGQGFIPGFVELIFDVDFTPEGSAALADGNGSFDVTIAPSGRPAGTYRIAAQQRDVNQTLSVATFDAFIVPCEADIPTLVIRPGSASPGLVVQVQGVGFPAGSTVNLFWSRGIDAGRPMEVAVGDDGSFVRQVLIFAHDFTGPREMTAGTPADPAAFPDARASILIAPGQGSPPAYTIPDAGPLEPGPIIIRR